MLTHTELQLNRIAQGQVSDGDGYSWFESQLKEEQTHTLGVLARLCQQAHPLAMEVPQAIWHAGLKRSFTPCVLLESAIRPELALNKIIALPVVEYEKAFRLLIALFRIADTRRRATHCKDGCAHAWHNLPLEN
ncbi:DUF5958 family protein [Massilia sp. SR12]